jgi:hypothetical protein
VSEKNLVLVIRNGGLVITTGWLRQGLLGSLTLLQYYGHHLVSLLSKLDRVCAQLG